MGKFLIVLIVFVLFVLVLALLGTLIIYSLDTQQHTDDDYLDYMDTASATSTTPTTTTSISTSTTLTREKLTSTTTTLLSILSVNVGPEKFYSKDPASTRLHKGDTIVVMVTDDANNELIDAEILVDDELIGHSNENGLYKMMNAVAGNHKLAVRRNGFKETVIDFTVDESPYGLSRHVRRLLSDEERRDFIEDGMVSFRFYDLPSCAICRVMRPRVSEIISENRDCIVYELVSLWKYNKELSGKFIRMQTPIIEIEGRGKSYQTSGMVSTKKLEDMIKQASPSCFTG